MIVCDTCGKEYEAGLPYCPLCGGAGPRAQGTGAELVFASCKINDVAGYSVCNGRAGGSADADAFSGHISIPERHNGLPVIEIGRRAFQFDKCIRSVYIPDTVLKIDDYAFDGCTALTRVFGGRHLCSVGEYAFRGCVQLERDGALNDHALFSFKYNSFAGCYRLPVMTGR